MLTSPKHTPKHTFDRPLELWGGLECTINRVGETYFDQLERGGHLGRLADPARTSDLEQIADLGIRTLRYGLHWERTAASGDWRHFDQALADMQRVGINPIAGLVHHGSGPTDTDLLDPGFAPRLAKHALAVAQRYPWIPSYTPVNEPQTTARFSGLYGYWYPHHHSMRSYVRALVNEIKASVLSMQAIRTVRSDARFITTEDGGKIWASPQLRWHGEMREHRRWLGLDLLCGRVDEIHPLFEFLLENGISQAEILWFAENPCPPDVIGLNYYVTSDRYLDHRLDMYPEGFPGGDTGSEPLVDMDALRVYPGPIAGSCRILTEAWQRYRIPVAITEAHLAGSVDDQILWLSEIWNGAQQARASGVCCVAVTVWALLGSFNWCHLVTKDTNAYEPGVFDLSDTARGPVRTGLAPFVQHLANGGAPPPARRQGWWSRPDRLLFPPDPATLEHEAEPTMSLSS